MKINEKITYVRKILKISQEALARKLGVSFATINRIEKGKTLPSYSTLEAFDNFCLENLIDFSGVDND